MVRQGYLDDFGTSGRVNGHGTQGEPAAGFVSIVRPSETAVAYPVSSLRLPGDLRDYQRDALAAFLAFRRGTLLMATATGKTVIAMAAMRDLGVPTAIVVPTLQLCDQWREKLQAAGIRDVGVYHGERKALRDVTVFVYNSAVLALRDPQEARIFDRFKFIVWDECHHLGGEEFRSLLALTQDGRPSLGLTASLREDSADHAPLLERMPVIFRYNVADAVAQGSVAPIDVQPIHASFADDEKQEYETWTDRIRSGMRKLGARDVADITNIAYHTKDEQIRMIAFGVLRAIARRKMLLAVVQDKKPKLLEILRRHPGERVLVFTESIESLDGSIRDDGVRAGVEEYLQHEGIRCATYHSAQPVGVRRMTLAGWGRSYDVLLSVRALDEGIDVPAISVGVILASGKSQRQLIQRIGRLLRISPGKESAHLYVIYVPGTTEDAMFAGVKDVVSRTSRGERIG